MVDIMIAKMVDTTIIILAPCHDPLRNLLPLHPQGQQQPNLNLSSSISEGSLPYTPSRIEWLSLVAQSASNATGLGSDYSILLTIDRKDTIFINILGKPPGATTQNIDEVIRTTRKLIMEIAESYKWESWVKIEVRK